MKENNQSFIIRYANKEDASIIVKFIRELAEYEGEINEVTVTIKNIEENVFEKKDATVIIGEENGIPIGFCLFHNTFSTFLGQKGIGVVDLYIEPQKRNKGYGTKIMSYIAGIAIDEGAGRFEWPVHDWNEKAITLYKRWGAYPIDNIRTYRLHGNALTKFAMRDNQN